MADFSTNATQLSGPQGAGSGTLAPVQEQVTPNAFMPALAGIANIFEKGLVNNAKMEAAKLEQGVVGGYVRDQQRINDGVISGEIKAERAAAMSRAAFGKYAAGNPQYIEQLHKAKNSMSGGSELGNIEDEEKAAKDTQKAREASARANGAIIEPWMNTQQKETVLRTSEGTTLAMKNYDMQVKFNSEQRAQGAEGRAMGAEQRTIFDRDQQNSSLKLVNELAGFHMNSISSTSQGVIEQVRSGKLTQEQGAFKLQEVFAGVSGVLQASAGLNSSQATAYKPIFDDMKATALKYLDPKTSADDAKALFDTYINKGKLFAAQSDPKVGALAVTTALLGDSAVTALAALPVVRETLTKMATVDFTTGQYVPQVVGNPEAEKDAIKYMRGALEKLNKGGYTDNTKAEKESINTVNHLLKQTGDLMNNPNAKPDYKKVTEMSKFLASPEYGQFAKSGKLDKDASAAAKYTWQSAYVPAVQGAISQELSNFLNAGRVIKGSESDNVSVASTVDVTFDGASVSFTSKENKNLSPNATRKQAGSLKELQSAQDSLNQLIRIGTHLDASTDYKAHWEANKHVYIPQIYVGEGVEYKGRISKGGRIDDPSTWKKVNE